MKIYYYNNKVRAEAESLADIQILLDLKKTQVSVPPPVEPKKKHKKHNFEKQCGICSGWYKGRQGLSRHKAYAHKTFPPVNTLTGVATTG